MTSRADFLATVVFGALALTSAPAAAQDGSGGRPGGGMGPPRTLGEAPAWADRLFGRLDANQDASVTGDELAVLSSGPAAAMGGGRLRRMIAQSDASNDGRISREELIAGTERMFRRMDADGDGVLSDGEMPRPAAPRLPPLPAPEPEPMPFPEMSDGD